MGGNLLPKTLDFGDLRADTERAASLANSEAAEAAVADLNNSSVTVLKMVRNSYYPASPAVYSIHHKHSEREGCY